MMLLSKRAGTCGQNVPCGLSTDARRCASVFRFIGLLLLILITGCATRRPVVLPPVTQPLPNAAAWETPEVISQGLLECLMQANHASVIREQWEWYFKYMKEHQRFYVEKRDKWMCEVAQAVHNSGSQPNIRILVIEHLDRPDFGSYDGVLLYTVLDHETKLRMPEGRCLKQLHSGQTKTEELQGPEMMQVDSSRWKTIEGHLKTLIKAGGGNNGLRSTFGYMDATVITYFDGARWQMQTWFWFSTKAEMLTDTPVAHVPREVCAFFRLLQFINTRLDRDYVFVPLGLSGYMDMFGDPDSVEAALGDTQAEPKR